MPGKGWISLHRQITEHWLWEDKPFAYGQAWSHLLLSANHEDKETLFNGKLIVVKRGELVTSIVKLSNIFGWDRKKTSKFLNLLEKSKMVTTIRTTHGTTITIVNYDNFQNLGTTVETTNRTATPPNGGQPLPTNNNVNNDNNINNIIICSELETTPSLSGILLPLNDKSFYDVPLDKIALWKDTYPAVDVEQELKKMVAWSDSNPTKRKTRKGIERFINNWLSKEQDKGGRYQNSSRQQTYKPKSSFNQFQQNDYDFEQLERELLDN